MRSSLLVAALALSACRSMDNYQRLLPRADAREDLSYAGDGHPMHALDVFAPKEPGPHPVVVFVHGGYWHAQDRRYLRRLVGLYSNVGVALAARGVVGVIPSYRLHPEVNIEAQLDDVVDAIAWTVAHADEHGGDPRRIVLAGHSAGAHLVLSAATEPERLRARGVDPATIRGVIAMSGVYDVPSLIARGLDRELIEGVVVPHFGPDPARHSPLDRLGPGLPPVAFLVGERDLPRCLADFAEAARRTRGTAARAVFSVLEGRSHADVVLEIGSRRDELTPRLVAFVDRVTR